MKKIILIVEDEPAYLTLLQSQLSEQGYIVLVAENGKKGLEIAKEANPDLILLDIRMPVMDGLTMLDLLRHDEAIKNTKVIMLTNLEPDDKIVTAVVRDQPSYYCVKSDIKFNELIENIERILGK